MHNTTNTLPVTVTVEAEPEVGGDMAAELTEPTLAALRKWAERFAADLVEEVDDGKILPVRVTVEVPDEDGVPEALRGEVVWAEAEPDEQPCPGGVDLEDLAQDAAERTLGMDADTDDLEALAERLLHHIEKEADSTTGDHRWHQIGSTYQVSGRTGWRRLCPCCGWMAETDQVGCDMIGTMLRRAEAGTVEEWIRDLAERLQD